MPDTVIGAENKAGSKTKFLPPWTSHPPDNQMDRHFCHQRDLGGSPTYKAVMGEFVGVSVQLLLEGGCGV